MKLCIIFFLSFGLTCHLVLSSPSTAVKGESSSPEAEQIAAVLEAAAAEAKAAAAASSEPVAVPGPAPDLTNENKAAPSSAVSGENSGVSAAAAAAASKKKGKSGYGLGYGNGGGYGNAGSVQTVLNFYPQQNGTGYGSYDNTTTSPPDANATTPNYDQKPVNYVIYIQPQAVYGQNGQQKPNYGLNQNYQTGQSLYNQNNGYGSVGQNAGYPGAQAQYGQSNLNTVSQYGNLNNNQYSGGVSSAQLGYGIQANYLQNPAAQPAVNSYGSNPSLVSGIYPGVNPGVGYGTPNAYNVQRPYSNGVVNSYGNNQVAVPSYGAQNAAVYPAGNPSYAVPVAVPAIYAQAQPAYTVGGYPTVPVSSYHGSASSSYQVRPQKPQSIYVSTYTQPQIYVKPGKPVSSSYSKPLSYLTASASSSGYGKPAQVALQAAYSKPQVVSYSKPQVTAYNSGPEVYVAVDDDQPEYKKSKEQKMKMKETIETAVENAKN